MIWASQRKKNTTWKIARLQTHFFRNLYFAVAPAQIWGTMFDLDPVCHQPVGYSPIFRASWFCFMSQLSQLFLPL